MKETQLLLPGFDEQYKIDAVTIDGMFIGVVMLGGEIVEETLWEYSSRREALAKAREIYKLVF